MLGGRVNLLTGGKVMVFHGNNTARLYHQISLTMTALDDDAISVSLEDDFPALTADCFNFHAVSLPLSRYWPLGLLGDR